MEFMNFPKGEHIEASLGAFIALSTMAAAALGNTISDILGIGSAYYVELLAQKIGFKRPKLTPIQLDLPRSRRAANLVSICWRKYISKHHFSRYWIIRSKFIKINWRTKIFIDKNSLEKAWKSWWFLLIKFLSIQSVAIVSMLAEFSLIQAKFVQRILVSNFSFFGLILYFGIGIETLWALKYFVKIDTFLKSLQIYLFSITYLFWSVNWILQILNDENDWFFF